MRLAELKVLGHTETFARVDIFNPFIVRAADHICGAVGTVVITDDDFQIVIILRSDCFQCHLKRVASLPGWDYDGEPIVSHLERPV